MALLAGLVALVVIPRAWGAEQGRLVLKVAVTDETGAAVPGAKIKLLNKASEETLQATSDEQGQFEFGAQLSTDYVVTVRARGFEEAAVPVHIDGSQPPPVRVVLEISETRERVNVTAEADSVPSANENPDAVQFDHNVLNDLPMKNGDPLGIPSLFVEPGVSGATGPRLIVDGVETDSVELPVTSIKQIDVNRSPYSAEFSRPGRGRLEVTTRRGNHHRYKGRISTLLRNSSIDARNAFAAVQPLRQRAISEAEVDGPLTRKLTFFLSARYDLNNESSVIDALTLEGPLSENVKAPLRNTHLFGRFDFRMNPSNKVTVYYKFKNKFGRNQGIRSFDLPERATNTFDHENEFKIIETMTLSGYSMNQLYMTLKQEREDTNAISRRTAIIVPGAFSAGGAQIEQHLRETGGNIQDFVGVTDGIHTLRFGGGARLKYLRAEDASNFGGTYTFSSLEDFANNRPLFFKLNEGDPRVSYNQEEYYTFLQDEIHVRKDLSISLGVRYERQVNVRNYRALAPRLALAYAPGGSHTVLRVGAGAFYERRPEIMARQSLLYNGWRIRQFVLEDPSYPPSPSQLSDLSLAISSLVRIAPNLHFPYLWQGSFAAEQKLGRGQNYLTVEFMGLRGVDLYRLHNINAPFPGTRFRPDPFFGNIDQFESLGTSRGYNVTVTYKGQIRRRLDFLSQYTLGRTADDASGYSSLPANNYDYRSEWGRSDFDRRHRLNVVGTYQLPRDFRLGGVVTWWSGLPFNITTGFDDNHDTVANDRPAGISRNAGKGPAYADVDMRFAKDFRLRPDGHTQVQLAIDTFNLFNHVILANYVGVLTSPFFGRANGAYPAREMQLSFRFNF
ncbi:MAG TPA: TonB-dependent receptor [Bryobacteraceae bacterium]|nr:TonB-dependent receptor [Bryobacteraceae bacterium]